MFKLPFLKRKWRHWSFASHGDEGYESFCLIAVCQAANKGRGVGQVLSVGNPIHMASYKH